MLLRGKVVLAIILSILLVGCSTTRLSQSSPVETRKTKAAKTNVELGMAYLERNNISQARNKLALALEQAPNIPETWYSMGYFLETTGHKKQASAYYQKAVEVAPRRADAQNNYGTYLCRSGRYNESISHFLLAVNDKQHLSPADAYENAGKCALKIPDHRSAARYFSAALEQEPKRPKAILKLAELNYQMGDYDASKKYLGQFLAVSSSTAQSNMLARHLVGKSGEGRQTRVMAAATQYSEPEEGYITHKIERPVYHAYHPKVVAYKYEPKSKSKYAARSIAFKPAAKNGKHKVMATSKGKRFASEHKKVALVSAAKHSVKGQKKIAHAASTKHSVKKLALNKKSKVVKVAKRQPKVDKPANIVMKKINVVNRELTV